MRGMSLSILFTSFALCACSSDDDGGNGTGTGGTSNGGTGNSTSGGSGGSATGGSAGSATGGSGGSAGSATGGTGGSAGAATGGTGGNCTYTDDFAGPTLSSCWSTLNGTPSTPLIDIATTGGALHLQAIPGQNGVWYQGSTKSLVYQLISGDFKVTTTARPRKRTDANAAPTIALHVGGLMARSPSSSGGGTENYVFTMVGSNEFAQPGVEIKSTTNGTSVWSEPVWPDPLGAELRICRLGSNFYLYKRSIGGTTWILADHQGNAAPINRIDLPPTLQVGMALNFSGGNNDLDVGFDQITLGSAPPANEADCTSD